MRGRTTCWTNISMLSSTIPVTAPTAFPTSWSAGITNSVPRRLATSGNMYDAGPPNPTISAMRLIDSEDTVYGGALTLPMGNQ